MLKKSAAMLAIATLVFSTSCKENAALKIDEETAKEAEIAHSESTKSPVLKFDNMEHDFGTIKQGEKVEHIYKFTNEGQGELVISQVKPSCGCTAPEWTKTPVAPGETGEIKVVFDSNGKSGKQSKTVNVHSNTESGTDILKFTATIEGSGIGVAPAAN